MTAKIYNLDDYRRKAFASQYTNININDAPRRCTECNKRAPVGVPDERFFIAMFEDCAFCSADCFRDF